MKKKNQKQRSFHKRTVSNTRGQHYPSNKPPNSNSRGSETSLHLRFSWSQNLRKVMENQDNAQRTYRGLAWKEGKPWQNDQRQTLEEDSEQKWCTCRTQTATAGPMSAFCRITRSRNMETVTELERSQTEVLLFFNREQIKMSNDEAVKESK